MTKTLVTFLLDKSGSMASCLDSTIEAFNAYVSELKKADIDFTFVQFDSQTGCELTKVYVAEPISVVRTLTRADYIPRGGTPLIEASIKVIEATADAVKAYGDKPKVVVCIQTDGQENQSARGYTNQRLKLLIEQKQAEGWMFNFMGAGINAYDQAAEMGVGVHDTFSYDSADRKSTMRAYGARGAATVAYAMGMSSNMNIGAAEKQAAGDKFFDPSSPNIVGSPVGTISLTKDATKSSGEFTLTR